jgi:hypothetical protein
MYRAASASGEFANADLSPRRPTTNRTAIRITNARNRYAQRKPPGCLPNQYPLVRSHLPARGSPRDGDTAEILSAERGTVCFADTARVFSVTYEPWSSRIFRSLTE